MLGHADRKHAHPAAVSPSDVLSTNPHRRAASTAIRSRNGRERLRAWRTRRAPPPSRGRRNVVRAIHELRYERLMLTLVADEAVVVVPLVLARASLELARPASSS
jgi:hypothetical protein